MKKLAAMFLLLFAVGFASVAVTGCPAPTNTEKAAEAAAETATEATADGGATD